jgi:hypothetical protein
MDTGANTMIEQEAIDYAAFCLSDRCTEAEAIDSILIWREQLEPNDWSQLTRALPGRVARRLYELQEIHDQRKIPVGATVVGAAGNPALVVGVDDGGVVVEIGGRERRVEVAAIVRWVYPITGREIANA